MTENMGTYNYSSFTKDAVGHGMKDVLQYYFSGNIQGISGSISTASLTNEQKDNARFYREANGYEKFFEVA